MTITPSVPPAATCSASYPPKGLVPSVALGHAAHSEPPPFPRALAWEGHCPNHWLSKWLQMRGREHVCLHAHTASGWDTGRCGPWCAGRTSSLGGSPASSQEEQMEPPAPRAGGKDK